MNRLLCLTCVKMFFVRCIEEILKTQRTLCDLLRPSLEILSVQTSSDTGLGELQCPGHATTDKNVNAKRNVTVVYSSSTVDNASAQAASRKLKQLSSMLCVLEYYSTARIRLELLICSWKKLLLCVMLPYLLAAVSLDTILKFGLWRYGLVLQYSFGFLWLLSLVCFAQASDTRAARPIWATPLILTRCLTTAPSPCLVIF